MSSSIKRTKSLLVVSLMIFIFSGCGEEDTGNPPNEESELVELKFEGEWSDNIGDSPNVSFIVEGRDGVMEGIFFWRHNFVACCGAPTLISFTISGTILQSLILDESRVACGGQNPGNGSIFTGGGTISNDGNSITMNLSADEDCGVGRREATITFTKVN